MRRGGSGDLPRRPALRGGSPQPPRKISAGSAIKANSLMRKELPEFLRKSSSGQTGRWPLVAQTTSGKWLVASGKWQGVRGK